MSNTATKMSRGFTIVELLIVIVVIAILAAISVAAYNGIQNRAADTAVQSDIRNLAMKVMEYQVINGEYPNGTPGSIFPGGIKLAINKGAYDTLTSNLYYCSITGTDNSRFSIAARSKSGKVFAFYDGGFQSYGGSFGNSTLICPNTGIPVDEPGFEYHYGHAYNSGTSTWTSWTNG